MPPNSHITPEAVPSGSITQSPSPASAHSSNSAGREDAQHGAKKANDGQSCNEKSRDDNRQAVRQNITVKICGITNKTSLDAAANNAPKARYIGFVFVQKSPRFIAIDSAKELSWSIPTGVKSVGLFAGPSDGELDAVLPYVMLDMIQLHGNETPERCLEIKRHTGLPIIKALSISRPSDLDALRHFDNDQADLFILDAAEGGSGEAFDWSMLHGIQSPKPWMLAGGLTPNNITKALEICTKLDNFHGLDVSSGVESQRGIKSPALITDFLNIVHNF